MKHDWEKTESGDIDEWAWSYEDCNGPICRACGKMPCVQCNPDYDKDEDCA